MNLIIRMVNGEDFIVDPNEFEATEDGANGLRSAINGNVGVSIDDSARDGRVLRIWPEPGNVCYVALREESDRLGRSRFG